jgi:asparagine synthase (glutamine-hydrolysing)
MGARERATVRRMMQLIEHRGPDGDGFWDGGGAVLGHRRLAIIDLEGGWQPMFNEAGTTGVVFNGEIFNYRELRGELTAAGRRFHTSSDTEVIVQAYEHWGLDFVARLRGMFGFALWDSEARRFLLVRDRFGVKPLYYAEGAGGRLLFASEIKALFADESVPRALNHARLAEYLAFRSIAGEETLFEGVREVAPGTMLILEDGRRRERRYWTPEVEFVETALSEEVIERGRDLLADAVRARLVSDVELGTITSGGLDSSLVSVVAASIAARQIDTFCVGFEDPALDERPFARAVARQIDSRHHEIVVTPEEIERELDTLTWANDEPLTHPNSVPMHLIFREAKECVGVTVLLSGEGADEMFGGYGRYAAAARRDGLRRLPGLALASAVAPSIGKLATLKRVVHPEYMLRASRFLEDEQLKNLLPASGDYLRERRSLWPRNAGDTSGLFVYDQRTYLPPLLQRQDRMSMAAGVEVRVPYLDHHLAEWANALRASVKLAGGERKSLLKKMAARWLPSEIIDRRKVGFEMPLDQFLRRGGALSHRVEALRDSSSLASQVMKRGSIERLIEEHNRREANHADLLWTLVALDAWAKVFLGASVRSERLPGAATGRVLQPVGELS